ncbi:M23 family metallopeptidase [Actinomyces ruminis]|uniref:M23 family metallopeptidase n=1 Tax=Actinomyces ruminis TaxID=1937003 RepID=UPI00211EA476|nr:M23 family metallopeptidase [Actinomyces ruminis]
MLVVLALVTVVAPLRSNLLTAPQALAALDLGSAAPTSAGSSTDPSSSVAAAVLGSDADVDTASDPELSNVPDAATLARIREAYENASATCAAQTTGASGDTAAFNSTPEVFYPMISGTYTVSSPYGYRLHPTLGYMKLHAGQDWAAAAGTPIYAAAAGTVVAAGMSSGTGTIIIEHQIDGQTWYTSYLHMYADGIYVSEGDQVEAGQLIAGVGSTGYSTGPHLHFEVRTANNTEDSSTVDPAEWLEEHGAVELTTDCS